MLYETANEPITDPVDSPTQFYIQELARLFELPYDGALADLSAQETREHIMKETGVSESDIDKLLLKSAKEAIIECGEVTDKEINENDPGFLVNMSELIRKSPEYTRQLLSEGLETNLDFDKAITKSWTACSRNRFHRHLETHSNILVYVCIGNFPAFQ